MDGIALAPWVGIGVIITGYVIDRIVIARKNGKAQGNFEGKIKTHIDDLKKTVDRLPCVDNPIYMQNMGRMFEKQESLDSRTKVIEFEVKELNKRIEYVHLGKRKKKNE